MSAATARILTEETAPYPTRTRSSVSFLHLFSRRIIPAFEVANERVFYSLLPLAKKGWIERRYFENLSLYNIHTSRPISVNRQIH